MTFQHQGSNTESRFLMLIAAMVAMASLTNCAAAPVSPAQLAPIHTVFLGPIDNPHISVRDGLNNDWIPSASNISLNDVVDRQGFRIGSETRAALSKAFAQQGYQVVSAPNDADAVVGVEIERAFYFPEPPIAGGGCEPFALFDVSMTSARTGATIFNRTYRFQSGGGTGLTGHILLDAGSKFNVDDCSALWVDPQKVIEAFRAAVAELSQAIVSEIKKPGTP